MNKNNLKTEFSLNLRTEKTRWWKIKCFHDGQARLIGSHIGAGIGLINPDFNADRQVHHIVVGFQCYFVKGWKSWPDDESQLLSI